MTPNGHDRSGRGERVVQRPWIGITTYHRGRSGFVKLPGEYADAVRRAGGIPVLLQPGEERLDELLGGLHGVLLSGGGDVDPALYGEERSGTALYGVNRERDDFERRLVLAALERNVPTLCICRGMQLLNVALGGSLMQHIPDVVSRAIAHRTEDGEPTPHAVEIEGSCGLRRVIGVSRSFGSSWHHQAVCELGGDLRAVAWASDGVVEAVESRAHSELLAVQWHPELSAAEDPEQQRLFDWLVGRAAVAGR